MRKSGTMILLSLFAVLTAVLLWFVVREILDERALEQPADARLLFVGNSFTGNNGLAQLVEELASELGPDWDDTFTTGVVPAGQRFVGHLRDIENEAENPLLRQLLVTGSGEARDWDLIVLQEQSQILGFGGQSPERVESVAAAAQLHQYASSTGATIMLMLTWGYAEGDPHNANIFPEFPTMQNRLTEGTYALANQLSTSGSQVYVIPAGRGFQLIYRDLFNSEQDPLAPGSRFRQLYAEDGQHPSLAGSYLAACIAVSAYTGESVAEIDWQPRQLDEEFAAYLRSVSDRVVFGAEFPPQPYPWPAQE